MTDRERALGYVANDVVTAINRAAREADMLGMPRFGVELRLLLRGVAKAVERENDRARHIRRDIS